LFVFHPRVYCIAPNCSAFQRVSRSVNVIFIKDFPNLIDDPSQRVNKVVHSNIETKLLEQISLIRQVSLGLVRQVKVRGICSFPDHPTNRCPQLQDDDMPQVNVMGGFKSQQRRYDPFSNQYNLGWKDHPNQLPFQLLTQ